MIFVDLRSRDGFGKGNCTEVELNCTSLGLPAICKTPVFVMIAESIPKPERDAHFINDVPGTLQDLQERQHPCSLAVRGSPSEPPILFSLVTLKR